MSGGGSGRTLADRNAAHTALMNAVLVALGSHPRLRLWRQDCGLFEVIGSLHRVRALPNGSPDVAGVLLLPSGVGQLVGLEIKTGSGEPNPAQTARLAMLRRFGALAGVVRSVGQATAAVDAALRGDWRPGDGLEL